MSALLVRNVPETIVAALRERAARRGVSMQQELLHILKDAATQPPQGEGPPPLRLVTVKTRGASTWRREEIYGDESR